MEAYLSQLYHGSLRPISPDKPLPDESGFMYAPSTPSEPSDRRPKSFPRPLRPSDFAKMRIDGRRKQANSSESTSTDSDDDTHTDTSDRFRPYLWPVILSTALVVSVLSFVFATALLGGRVKSALVQTTEEVFLPDFNEFGAIKENIDVPSARAHEPALFETISPPEESDKTTEDSPPGNTASR